MNNKNLLWYACYGSNLSYERFMAYINACADKTPPQKDAPCLLPHRLYFAGRSRWGGAAAFVETALDVSARTLGRAYLVTPGQFEDIRRQEGAGPRWYGNRLRLGELDGLPVYTLTRDREYDNAQPGTPPDDYLATIQTGLREAWPEVDAAAYLARVLEPSNQST